MCGQVWRRRKISAERIFEQLSYAPVRVVNFPCPFNVRSTEHHMPVDERSGETERVGDGFDLETGSGNLGSVFGTSPLRLLDVFSKAIGVWVREDPFLFLGG